MLKGMSHAIGRVFGAQKAGTSAKTGSSRSVHVETNANTRAGARSRQTYLATATPGDNLPRLDRNLAITDIARLSRVGGTREVLRELGHAAPDMSAAISAHIRSAITRNYSAIAKNMDGSFNQEGTNLVNQILARIDRIPDVTDGFSRFDTMRTISESLAKEILLYGGMMAELVLDDALVPHRIQPISITQIEWRPKGQRIIPVQVVGEDEITLDEATVFYTSLDQELMEAYASSPFESAIKPTFFSEELVADITRVVRRAIHPRVKVTIDEDSFRDNAPADTRMDEKKMDEYLDGVVEGIASAVNGLNPEDALVLMDSVTVEMLNNGNISLSRELETLENMGNANLSTGTKTPPTILGHNEGTSNIASTETLLFLKQVEGSVQLKLNEMYSRMLTLAVRLMGVDGYVEFKYEEIVLRPEIELEAFKAQRQSRVLELLSIGKVTDEEASLILSNRLPLEDEARLSGTFFKSKNPSDENPYNGEENSGSTLNQNLEPDTSTGVRGGNRKHNPQKEDE